MRSINLFRLALLVLLAVSIARVEPALADESESDFFIKPYVQLGNNPQLCAPEKEALVWFSQNEKADWKVETKVADSDQWTSTNASIHKHEVLDAPITPMFEFVCDLHDLPPGKVFDYRVLENGKSIFTAWALARKAADQPYRFSVFGDCGAGTEGQKLVAYHVYETKPDFVVIPGDITYNAGLFHEYMTRFFPVYNNDSPDRTRGVPLMRSTIIAPVLGNHDIALGGGYPTNFNRYPDALAYYVLWNPPLNGPNKSASKKETAGGYPAFDGNSAVCKNFLKSAASEYPRSNMYSFDWGNSHWLVLDGNLYMNWRDVRLRKWVEDDLAGSSATWKFVTFHQPGFSCDIEHAQEQRMRLLSDIFQRQGVDIVFAGHAHNYQRTFPMMFNPTLSNGRPQINSDGTVPGALELDRKFDGKANTVPHGPIYIVTGGGGAHLYGMKPECVQQTLDSNHYIVKFVWNTHSFTDCQVEGSTLKFTQIASNGQTIDGFTITKK